MRASFRIVEWIGALLVLVAVWIGALPADEPATNAHPVEETLAEPSSRSTRKLASLLNVDPRVTRHVDHVMPLVLVSDMDHSSWNNVTKRWESLLAEGRLERTRTGEDGLPRFTVTWHHPTRPSRTHTKFNNNGRSMELSDVVRYGKLLYGVCDATGIVWKLRRQGPSAPADGMWRRPGPNAPPAAVEAFPRWILAAGHGNRQNPMKSEWATVQDGRVVVGSIGRPWFDERTGEPIHFDARWIKVIDEAGNIKNFDWSPAFLALQAAAGAPDGYLWHEAVEWLPRTREWLFLPRKQSDGQWAEGEDEMHGSNLLLSASEDFSRVNASVRVGLLELDWGFTAMRAVPGMAGDIMVAIKAREVKGTARSKLCVFDRHTGTLLLESHSGGRATRHTLPLRASELAGQVDDSGCVPVPIPEGVLHAKFEGVEFLRM